MTRELGFDTTGDDRRKGHGLGRGTAGIRTFALAALTLTRTGLRTHSEALTYDEVVTTFAHVLGRHISYVHPNVVQFWALLYEHHQPVALFMAVLYAAALGQASHLSGESRRRLGRDPIRFLQFTHDYSSVWQQEARRPAPVPA